MTLLDDIRADAAEFLADFGVSAVYSSALDGLKEITVIFDPENPVINPDTGEVENIEPAATARTDDVPNARHRDTLKIGGVTYEIREVRPDGAGITTLRLGRQ